jgi:hypothetical protein
MADPVGDIIGDYRAFAAQQQDRLLSRGIAARPYPLSNLAVRVPGVGPPPGSARKALGRQSRKRVERPPGRP